MTKNPKWEDLRDRVIYGAGMAVLGMLGIWLGGIWFQMLAVFVTAVMIWELTLMVRLDAPTQGMLLAAFTASVLSGLLATEQTGLILSLLFVPAIVGAVMMPRERLTFFLFALGIVVAGWGLVVFRETYGVVWLFWLIAVVIATDIFGYFAGRMIGGPKFWPAVSPKKTWSGTIAGWVASAIIGFIFLGFTNAGNDLPWISVALSFASQMGDIAESALKRRMKVKDSSTLIPGHGGLFDRFDGLLGAALVMLFVALVVDIPEVRF
ncbi:phosphatidate cytidylyltransferase [Parasulfitobacter algicola]|uniref:Phosphatidate cytidylyltransferase n=1 Tax=Parasulfitobacter algicola TaxID=2614809 RepID=A0ABX2IXV4_9RHOB|nr:phosphatidate cytidylyltransferase [Sulfitobacter algicola]NSX55374.1 phosphatidate cytidylyltransferase [Sulfitobacter algicola]